MSNACPKCSEKAMDALAKILKRPVACESCGQELRMNLLFTIVLSAIYFFVVIRILLSQGMTGMGMVYVLVVTGLFVGGCLFVPFEEKPEKSEAE